MRVKPPTLTSWPRARDHCVSSAWSVSWGGKAGTGAGRWKSFAEGSLESLPKGNQEFPFPYISQPGQSRQPCFASQGSARLLSRAAQFPRTGSRGIWLPQGCAFGTAGHGPSVNGSTVLLTWVKNLSVQLFSIRRLKLKICGQSNLIYDTVIIIINVVFSFVW